MTARKVVAKTEVAKTARLRDLDTLDTVESPVEEMSEPEDGKQIAGEVVKSALPDVKPEETGGFNSPKIVPVRGERYYTGPVTELMNELYDAMEVPAIEVLPGWERIAHLVAKACERLEMSGWKRGK